MPARGSGHIRWFAAKSFERTAAEPLLCPAPGVAPGAAAAVDRGEHHEGLRRCGSDVDRIGEDAALAERVIEPGKGELAPVRAAVGGGQELERSVRCAAWPRPCGTERDLSFGVAFVRHRIDERVPELLRRHKGIEQLVSRDPGQPPPRVEAREEALRIEEGEEHLGRHGARTGLRWLRRRRAAATPTTATAAAAGSAASRASATAV